MSRRRLAEGMTSDIQHSPAIICEFKSLQPPDFSDLQAPIAVLKTATEAAEQRPNDAATASHQSAGMVYTTLRRVFLSGAACSAFHLRLWMMAAVPCFLLGAIVLA